MSSNFDKVLDGLCGCVNILNNTINNKVNSKKDARNSLKSCHVLKSSLKTLGDKLEREAGVVAQKVVGTSPLDLKNKLNTSIEKFH